MAKDKKAVQDIIDERRKKAENHDEKKMKEEDKKLMNKLSYEN